MTNNMKHQCLEELGLAELSVKTVLSNLRACDQPRAIRVIHSILEQISNAQILINEGERAAVGLPDDPKSPTSKHLPYFGNRAETGVVKL